MNKVYPVALLVVAAIVLAVYFLFLPAYKNYHNSNPDISCVTDSDCKLMPYDYTQCGCGKCGIYKVSDNDVVAISSNWLPICETRACPECVSGIENPNSVRCIENTCQKIT